MIGNFTKPRFFGTLSYARMLRRAGISVVERRVRLFGYNSAFFDGWIARMNFDVYKEVER